jgi:hypothetical protein
MTRRCSVSTTEIALLVVVIAAAAVAVFFILRKQRTRKLRDRFGPEYERTVRTVGDQTRAERELESREKRVESFDIRPLRPQDREQFTEDWRRTQAHFVDRPVEAVQEADALVKELMQVRGYPVGNFEQRVADISVHHPRVVQNYRAARDIAERNQQGKASTEDLRQAMVHYRELFEDLLVSDEKTVKKERKKAEKEGVR